MQRTRFRLLLTRHPLGVTVPRLKVPRVFAGVTLLVMAIACRTSRPVAADGTVPTAERVAVHVVTYRGLMQGGFAPLLEGTQATVVLRNEDGSVAFRGETDATGRIRLPLRPYSVRYGQQLEAMAIYAGFATGAIRTVVPGSASYLLVLAPAALFREDDDDDGLELPLRKLQRRARLVHVDDAARLVRACAREFETSSKPTQTTAPDGPGQPGTWGIPSIYGCLGLSGIEF